MEVQDRERRETQERGTGVQKKGGAGDEWFALVKVSRVSRVARALGGSWWPFRLPGPQGYYFLTPEPGLGPKGPRALTIWAFVGKVMSLLFNTLSRFVTAFLPRSKHLITLWLQSLSAVNLKPKKIKSVSSSTFYLPQSDGIRCHDGF